LRRGWVVVVVLLTVVQVATVVRWKEEKLHCKLFWKEIFYAGEIFRGRKIFYAGEILCGREIFYAGEIFCGREIFYRRKYFLGGKYFTEGKIFYATEKIHLN
jgi:hypothetical protein